jgi:hypothetical protein
MAYRSWLMASIDHAISHRPTAMIAATSDGAAGPVDGATLAAHDIPADVTVRHW